MRENPRAGNRHHLEVDPELMPSNTRRTLAAAHSAERSTASAVIAANHRLTGSFRKLPDPVPISRCTQRPVARGSYRA
jgi:hypothetical protein